jgi:hypothetical protein
MMRLPLPVIFAALVVVAAGSVLLNVHTKSDAYVINATHLGPWQNMTITLDFIPTKIRVLGDPSRWYRVVIYANATFAEPAEMYYGIVYDGVYTFFVMGNQTAEIRVVDVRGARAKIFVYAYP